jgi:hypothetical protein
MTFRPEEGTGAFVSMISLSNSLYYALVNIRLAFELVMASLCSTVHLLSCQCLLPWWYEATE